MINAFPVLPNEVINLWDICMTYRMVHNIFGKIVEKGIVIDWLVSYETTMSMMAYRLLGRDNEALCYLMRELYHSPVHNSHESTINQGDSINSLQGNKLTCLLTQ